LCVYLIEKSGKYYTGITTDLPNRLYQHGVSEAFYFEDGLTRDQAVKKEIEIKGWTWEKKESLIQGVCASPHG